MIPETRKVLKNRLFVPKSLMIPEAFSIKTLTLQAFPPIRPRFLEMDEFEPPCRRQTARRFAGMEEDFRDVAAL
jgi:hypothetical protein